MYWIYVETEFEASHQLTFADGEYEPLHTHVWHVTAGVCAGKLNGEGMVMDFHALEQIVQSAVAPYRGKQLEIITCFSGRNASAERVARSLFDAVAPRLLPPARLGFIEVTEAAGCRARYQPGV